MPIKRVIRSGESCNGRPWKWDWGVEDVRIGKNITLQVNADSAEKAKQIAEDASKKLLSNPVMEYFEVSVN
jgi:phosphoribosylformylglycinamidine (FGAM) synthase PurS component